MGNPRYEIRIIEKLKKRNPNYIRSKKKRVSYTDYYMWIRESLPFSVDWERGDIYAVPDTANKPLIEKINMKTGKSEEYEVDIDFKKFKIHKEEIKHFCEWFNEELPAFIKKAVKLICYIPSYPPPIQGIKVLKNWLLVTTGKRKWNEGKNLVLVYCLPELKYEGSFYIPFPGYGMKPKWLGKYYITNEMSEGYKSKYTIYQVEEK